MRKPPPEDTTHLYLVRHGATPANERRPYILQGDGIDLALSPTGERQVAALGRFLRDFPIRHVYSSTLIRARQSAEAVAAHHELPVQTLERLTECNVGEWEGMDWESIQAKYPEAWKRFHEDPGSNPYLGGESYGDVFRRAQPVIEGLVEQHRGESIVVVAHNIVNRVYLAGLLGIELRRAPSLRQQNACINFITHDRHGSALTTMNAVFHLDEA